MASPAERVAAIELQPKDKISEIKGLQAEGREKERSWFIGLPFSWARASWAASRADLRAAQERMREVEETLTSQFSSAGRSSANDE